MQPDRETNGRLLLLRAGRLGYIDTVRPDYFASDKRCSEADKRKADFRWKSVSRTRHCRWEDDEAMRAAVRFARIETIVDKYSAVRCHRKALGPTVPADAPLS